MGLQDKFYSTFLDVGALEKIIKKLLRKGSSNECALQTEMMLLLLPNYFIVTLWLGYITL